MESADHPRFEECMMRMVVTLTARRVRDQREILAYWDALEDLPIEHLETASKYFARTSAEGQIPSPATLREYVGRLMGRSQATPVQQQFTEWIERHRQTKLAPEELKETMQRIMRTLSERQPPALKEPAHDPGPKASPVVQLSTRRAKTHMQEARNGQTPDQRHGGTR